MLPLLIFNILFYFSFWSIQYIGFNIPVISYVVPICHKIFNFYLTPIHPNILKRRRKRKQSTNLQIYIDPQKKAKKLTIGCTRCLFIVVLYYCRCCWCCLLLATADVFTFAAPRFGTLLQHQRFD